MEPGNIIRAKGESDGEKIARILHEKGFIVLELSVVKRDIEEYFVELMEGGTSNV